MIALALCSFILAACGGGSPNPSSTAKAETITVTVPQWDIAKAIEYWSSSGAKTAQEVWRQALCDSSEPVPKEVSEDSTSITFQVHLSSQEVAKIQHALSSSALCSVYSVSASYQIVFNTQALNALATTTTAPPPTSTTTAPPPTSTTTAVAASGYFNVAQVEGYLSSVAESSQGDALDWSGDQASTDDGVCTFTLTNSEGESASLADSIAISCGPPSISDTLSKADVDEATPYLLGIVQDICGTIASSWLTQEISDVGDGSGLVADKLFGSVAIDVNYGDGQLSETLLWQG